MNSCLLHYYPSKNFSSRLHADNEKVLDQTQPICTVSFGDSREIQYFNKFQDSRDEPLLKIDLQSGSIVRMLPGCQANFKHRVPKSTNNGQRFSLSFRHMLSNNNHINVTSPSKVKLTRLTYQVDLTTLTLCTMHIKCRPLTALACNSSDK